MRKLGIFFYPFEREMKALKYKTVFCTVGPKAPWWRKMQRDFNCSLLDHLRDAYIIFLPKLMHMQKFCNK